MSDRWDEYADSYAEWSSRQTLPYAKHALDLVNIGERAKILDVATGDGAFTLEAAARHPTSSIVAIDYSSAMIDILDERIKERGLGAIISTKVGDAQALDFPNDSFDCVAVVFGLFLMTDGLQCLQEIHRVLKPGGTLVFTSWGQTFVSDLVFGALLAIDAEAAMKRVLFKCTNVAKPGTWNNHDWIREKCLNAGFGSPEIHVVSHPTQVHVNEKDSFAKMLGGGPGIRFLMRAEGWTEENSKRVEEGLAAALNGLFDSGVENVYLVSSANVVICKNE